MESAPSRRLKFDFYLPKVHIYYTNLGGYASNEIEKSISEYNERVFDIEEKK